MESIRYHPLVSNDDEGTERVPLFYTEDRQTVSERHDLYLEEAVPHYYRLCAKHPHTEDDAAKYRVRCPLCGRTMKTISRPTDHHRLSLYCCSECSGKEQ